MKVIFFMMIIILKILIIHIFLIIIVVELPKKNKSFKEISMKKNKAIKIDIKRSKSLDKIDNNFHFSFKGVINKEYESFLDDNISLLSYKNEPFLEESFEMDDF